MAQTLRQKIKEMVAKYSDEAIMEQLCTMYGFNPCPDQIRDDLRSKGLTLPNVLEEIIVANFEDRFYLRDRGIDPDTIDREARAEIVSQCTVRKLFGDLVRN